MAGIDNFNNPKWALVLVIAGGVATALNRWFAYYLDLRLLRRKAAKLGHAKHKHTMAHSRPPVHSVEVPCDGCEGCKGK